MAVSLDDVIRDCLRGFAPQAKARGIILDFRPEGESPRVRIKRAELSQVINSLIANSLEAIGQAGEVTVRRNEGDTAVSPDNRGQRARHCAGDCLEAVSSRTPPEKQRASVSAFR